MVNATRDSEELTKQIDGVALAGRAAIFIDNMADGSELRSIPIAQTLSQPSREIRPLGRSTMIEVPCNQMVLVNGVNPRIAADLSRRFLHCGLDPNVENPEERVYRRPNIFEDAQRERVSILTDCFTIVVSYLHSGERVPGQPLSGFTDWARHVQEPLIWLGEPDPVESRKKIVAEDPVKATLVRLFRAWHALHGISPVTAADLLAGAAENTSDEGVTDEERRARESARKELAQVADEIARDKAGKLSAKTLGYYLRGKKSRIAHGLRLEFHGETRDGATLYCIVPTNPIESNEDRSSDDVSSETDASSDKEDMSDGDEVSSDKGKDLDWDDILEFEIRCPRNVVPHVRSILQGLHASESHGGAELTFHAQVPPGKVCALKAHLAQVGASVSMLAGAPKPDPKTVVKELAPRELALRGGSVSGRG